MRLVRPILGVTLGLWLLLGIGYPLAMTGISQVLFPSQAQGNLVYLNGRVVASRHVGQYFSTPQYFWGRPSATLSVSTGKPKPYNAFASAPSNLGPTNAALLNTIKARIEHLLATTPGLTVNQIPASLVEGSGSGLDPNISPQAAYIQVPRVAQATGLSEVFLRQLITQSIEAPQFGLFGRSRINVTLLNIQVYRMLHGGT
ncbi:MAG: potassium-transporting ATPase subunit KdpC [Thermaerobacter sp.]|nr:potassium-transporting ATPase subunit KdpC [Thermaerobacter sp.]